MRMVSTLLRAWLIFGGFAAFPLMAVEKGNLSSINTGDSALTEVKAEDFAPRARVPLRLTMYESVVVRNEAGNRRIVNKPLNPVRYNFKATIDRINHFYLNDLHVETIPEKWDHDSRQWSLTVHFYKRYGEGQDLEESIGSMSIAGNLEGDASPYMLKALAQKNFKDKNGNPLLNVEINSKNASEKGNIARRETRGAQ